LTGGARKHPPVFFLPAIQRGAMNGLSSAASVAGSRP
jgi:hypothetical protein